MRHDVAKSVSSTSMSFFVTFIPPPYLHVQRQRPLQWPFVRRSACLLVCKGVIEGSLVLVGKSNEIYAGYLPLPYSLLSNLEFYAKSL